MKNLILFLTTWILFGYTAADRPIISAPGGKVIIAPKTSGGVTTEMISADPAGTVYFANGLSGYGAAKVVGDANPYNIAVTDQDIHIYTPTASRDVNLPATDGSAWNTGDTRLHPFSVTYSTRY